MNDLSTQTPREPEWYISICPETGRRFLCETGRDDNIAELFATKREEDLITGAKAMFAALQFIADDIADGVKDRAAWRRVARAALATARGKERGEEA